MDKFIRESIRRKFDPKTKGYKNLTALEVTSMTTQLARELPSTNPYDGGLVKGDNVNPADFLIEPIRTWRR